MLTELYCVNECGHKIDILDVTADEEEIKGVTIRASCPLCNDVTAHEEDVKMKTTFRCTECDLEKEAHVKPSSKRLVTTKPCPECGEETKWEQTGWKEIEVE